MRYCIILASLALCAASLPVSDIFSLNISATPKSRSRSIKEDGTRHVQLSRSHYKTKDRQRRSIWMNLLNHISTAVETFHAKPLFVEGIQDMDSFAIKTKNEFRDTPKSINAMLSKGVRSGELLTSSEEKKKEINDMIDKVGTDSKSFPSKERMMDTDEEWEKQKKTMASKFKGLTDEEVKFLREKVKEISNLNDLAYSFEDNLFDYLIENKGDKEIKYIDELYDRGTNDAISEDIMKQIIANNPDVKDRISTDLRTIRQWREDIKFREYELDKIPSYSTVSDEEIQDLEITRHYVRFVNNNWLEHKHDQELMDMLLKKIKTNETKK